MAESTSQISGGFTLVENSSLNGVIFHNIQAVYTADESINCVYSIMDDIEPEFGDVIGLIKVGWTSSSQCLTSVPAKAPVNNDKQFLNSVFGAHLLPNESSDLYQFCYISKMRVVGASTPFTFESSSDIIAVEDPTDPGLLVFKSRVSQLKDEIHKLFDEKTYFASKYRILYSNFMKLKAKFDNLEQQLLSEKENSKRLEEVNSTLLKQFKEKYDRSNLPQEMVEPKNSVSVSPTEASGVQDDSKLIRNLILPFNSDIWKFLSEIYAVATEINQSFKNEGKGTVPQMSYQDFVNVILEVFSAAKLESQIKKCGKIDESAFCKCYFEQKALCCPSLCSEALFQSILAKPLYTCFSNFYHYTKLGGIFCDGSFDSSSLTEFIKNVKESQNVRSINTETYSIENNNDSYSEVISREKEVENNFRSYKVHEANEQQRHKYCSDVSRMDEEREKVSNELKLSKEKITSLNSRVNVLELELVAQQSDHIRNNETLNEDSGQVSVPSSSPVNTLEIESVLECVNNEYMNLKDKYRELSKNVAKMYSLEAKCSALEEENAKLIHYLTGICEQKEKYSDSSEKFCAELETLLSQKNKAENKLISLQKPSVGKISMNLIQQNHEVYGKKDKSKTTNKQG